MISVLFVVTSTISLTLSTLPSLQGPHGADNVYLSQLEAVCVTLPFTLTEFRVQFNIFTQSFTK